MNFTPLLSATVLCVITIPKTLTGFLCRVSQFGNKLNIISVDIFRYLFSFLWSLKSVSYYCICYCQSSVGREAPARTPTGAPDMLLWTWQLTPSLMCSQRSSRSSGVTWSRRRVSVVQWRSAQTTTCAAQCPANRRVANYNSPTNRMKTSQLRFLQLPPSSIERW